MPPIQKRRKVSRNSGLVRSAAALGGVAACTSTDTSGGGGDGEGDLLSRLQEAGTITVGFAGEAPYSFEEDGELTGATVALHREIFGELGIDEVEGVAVDFGSLIPGLTAERFDAVSAGMPILPERCAEDAVETHSFVDSELTVTSGCGAIETDYAAQLGLNRIEVGGPQHGLDAINSGNADAFALRGIPLNSMAESSNVDVE